MTNANYKTEGTKEFQKMNFLKELLTDTDPYTRKKAFELYTKVTKTEYDKLITQLEQQIDNMETVLRKSDKRKLIESMKAEAKGQKLVEKSYDKDDMNFINEINSLKFKLKYYNSLKDIEIDSKLKKTKIDF